MEVLGLVIAGLLLFAVFKYVEHTKAASKQAVKLDKEMKEIEETTRQIKKVEKSYDEAKKDFANKYNVNSDN